MIVAAAWSFQSGWTLSGQILGWGLVSAAFVNVSTGFCIPSFLYGLFSENQQPATSDRKEKGTFDPMSHELSVRLPNNGDTKIL